MTTITDGLIEELLNETEGEALDFKRDQYQFTGASDEEKSELLKDVLAFANSWRRTDAFILVGVQQARVGRSEPVGVSEHLDDASLQQFVCSKTQRPLQFRYVPREFEGVQLGLLQIPVQKRPIYLNRDYGRLQQDAVYIRRGSSTDVAKPDELTRMGAPLGRLDVPSLAFVAELLDVHNIDHAHWVSAAVGILNNGAVPARSPYIEMAIPEGCRWSGYGLDGNRREGLIRVPRAHEGRSRAYGGTPDVVVHPGTKRMVTQMEIRVPQQNKRVPEVLITYLISAEEMEAVRGEHEVTAEEVLELIG